MPLKLIVTDRESIERGFLVRGAYALISIRDPDRRRVKIPRSPLLKATLELAFHDAEPSAGFLLPENIRLMSEEDAAEIWRFVRELPVEVETLVVHCEQGMSRSPAVAAGLSLGLGTDPDFFRKNYQPNAYVLNLVAQSGRKML
jgi:predicted protein tyrosine phosphatase